MGDLVEITTWPQHKCQFYKVTSNALSVEIKGDIATILLVEQPENDTKGFKIALGHHYSDSFIQILGTDSEPSVAVHTPVMVTNNEYREFWLTWFGASLRVGVAGQAEPFMTLPFASHPAAPRDSLALQYVGFLIDDEYGYEPVRWRFSLSPVKLRPKEAKVVKGGKAEWVKVGNQLPDNALIGGYCKLQQENLYIIRAEHRGSVTPGKFVPSEGLGYVPWGGAANEKEEFDVLCGFNAQWVPTRTNVIPAGAIAGGTSEDLDEVLYIGRAYYEGSLVPGKVQPSHKVCYIAYGDREIAIQEYEILVDPERVVPGSLIRPVYYQ